MSYKPINLEERVKNDIEQLSEKYQRPISLVKRDYDARSHNYNLPDALVQHKVIIKKLTEWYERGRT